MTSAEMIIRPYLSEEESEVIRPWCKCNLTRARNNPEKDIERKSEVDPELFLIGLIDNKLVATVMGGYEGHRGWVNYLAVNPDYQRRGPGRQIMEAVENRLQDMDCPKINLQIRTDNQGAAAFYEHIGYKMEERVSMGKRLLVDEER